MSMFAAMPGMPRRETRDAAARDAGAPEEALRVTAFWTEAGPARWFAKDATFDDYFRLRFLASHEAAARGAFADWARHPQGALALLLLLDQFPRNCFRGTARMYATDPLARSVASAAVAAGLDRGVVLEQQKFFYLPFAHSEDLADQDRSVALCARIGGIDFAHAQRHRDIIRRFGRFPHRNPILGRAMRAEEQAFLDAGGYAG